ncbi:uncharacterized protein [Miscanthus floridulus]|uniref:uncharacterized protein isoform X2 n=1 Tax=Miscanthus floridulus TaxID=154761 RepID=UPI0034591B03
MQTIQGKTYNNLVNLHFILGAGELLHLKPLDFRPQPRRIDGRIGAMEDDNLDRDTNYPGDWKDLLASILGEMKKNTGEVKKNTALLESILGEMKQKNRNKQDQNPPMGKGEEIVTFHEEHQECRPLFPGSWSGQSLPQPVSLRTEGKKYRLHIVGEVYNHEVPGKNGSITRKVIREEPFKVEVILKDGDQEVDPKDPIASLRVELVVLDREYYMEGSTHWGPEEFEGHFMLESLKDKNKMVSKDSDHRSSTRVKVDKGTFNLVGGRWVHESASINKFSEKNVEVQLGVMVCPADRGQERVLEGVSSNKFDVIDKPRRPKTGTPQLNANDSGQNVQQFGQLALHPGSGGTAPPQAFGLPASATTHQGISSPTLPTTYNTAGAHDGLRPNNPMMGRNAFGSSVEAADPNECPAMSSQLEYTEHQFTANQQPSEGLLQAPSTVGNFSLTRPPTNCTAGAHHAPRPHNLTMGYSINDDVHGILSHYLSSGVARIKQGNSGTPGGQSYDGAQGNAQPDYNNFNPMDVVQNIDPSGQGGSGGQQYGSNPDVLDEQYGGSFAAVVRHPSAGEARHAAPLLRRLQRDPGPTPPHQPSAPQLAPSYLSLSLPRGDGAPRAAHRPPPPLPFLSTVSPHRRPPPPLFLSPVSPYRRPPPPVPLAGESPQPLIFPSPSLSPSLLMRQGGGTGESPPAADSNLSLASSSVPRVHM